MKSEEEILDLICRHLDGDASDEDRLALQEELRRDPAARRHFARYANIDMMLGDGIIPPGAPALAKGTVRPRVPSWNPLAAAAAGLAAGLFSATLVFGFSGNFSADAIRIDLEVADGGFEGEAPELGSGFPTGPGIWSVDDAEVAKREDGSHALRLRPRPRHPYSRAVQIVDLSRLDRENPTSLELSAKFTSPDSAHACRYKLRLIGFAETADVLQPFPLDTAEEGIVSSAQVLDVPAGAAGWHRVTTVMPLPPEVRTVVLWLGASTHPRTGTKEVHWIDEVRLQRISVLPATPASGTP